MRTILAAIVLAVLSIQALADEAQVITVDGVRRTYILVGMKRERPRPLILALHGNLGTGAQFLRYGQWRKVADGHDVAIVLPDGLNTAWADGREHRAYLGSRRPPLGTDDVKFLGTLVERLIADGFADKSRVYVTGVSNGGMMTYRMLCERADLFAAGAAMIASMPVGLPARCHPSRAVPILVMNGTKDRLVPYEPSRLFTGTDRTSDFWRKINGCKDTANTEALPAADPRPLSRVFRITYACPRSQAVIVYRIEGGGHQMPSLSRGRALEWIIGGRNHDMEGAEEIWSFFDRFASPPR